MSKFALLIGINYIQIPILTLRGCIDDIELVSQTLQSQFKYDPENIVMLRDDRGEPLRERRYWENYANSLHKASTQRKFGFIIVDMDPGLAHSQV